MGKLHLHSLKMEDRVSRSSMNQAYSALRFLYEVSLGRKWNGLMIPRSRKEKRLPVVLAPDEVRKVLGGERRSASSLSCIPGPGRS